jgi:hypothetical protein
MKKYQNINVRRTWCLKQEEGDSDNLTNISAISKGTAK